LNLELFVSVHRRELTFSGKYLKELESERERDRQTMISTFVHTIEKERKKCIHVYQ